MAEPTPFGPLRTGAIVLQSPQEPLGLDFSKQGSHVVCIGVQEDSPTARAGLPDPPFIIVSINGVPTKEEHDVVQAVTDGKGRGQLRFALVVQQCQLPAESLPPPPEPRAGGEVRRYTVRLSDPSERFGLSFSEQDDGLYVVETAHAAQRAGIPSGPNVLFRSLDGWTVTTPAAVDAAVRRMRASGAGECAVDVELLPAEGSDAASPLLSEASPTNQQWGSSAPFSAAPAAEPVVPAMPFFEPAHSGDALAALRNAGPKGGADWGGDIPSFTFPADTAFWENFQQQVRLCDGAQDPPLFEVSASHDSSTKLNVNQGFMRSFVKGWEDSNPHTVTVFYPGGEQQFHVSKEFWADVVGGLSAAAQARESSGAPRPANAVEIVSAQEPGSAPVVASAEDWNNACAQWEERKKLTLADREAHGRQRWAEVARREEQRRLNAEAERARRSISMAPPQPQRPLRHSATQYVDPKDFIFLDHLKPLPPQNRRPPFTSAPPAPYDAPPPITEGSPAAPRLRPDRFGSWCLHCAGTGRSAAPAPGGVERVLSPSRGATPSARAPAAAAPGFPPPAALPGPPVGPQPPAGAGAVAGVGQAVRCGGPRATPFWDTFVAEWEAVAAEVQHGASPPRPQRLVVNPAEL
eukprot:TRINITY_DN2682_c0_g2_i1.p1 TRINITY_DN2682_c0_g2~~TRINITY_DN2682_c0_g2_i1.p1  ORF type:complete len:635 (+),score=179.92 TRINITY_DN2682_c0_g2_i1:78-1982(+)